jgi:hypothetical protein
METTAIASPVLLLPNHLTAAVRMQCATAGVGTRLHTHRMQADPAVAQYSRVYMRQLGAAAAYNKSIANKRAQAANNTAHTWSTHVLGKRRTSCTHSV